MLSTMRRQGPWMLPGKRVICRHHLILEWDVHSGKGDGLPGRLILSWEKFDSGTSPFSLERGKCGEWMGGAYINYGVHLWEP